MITNQQRSIVLLGNKIKSRNSTCQDRRSPFEEGYIFAVVFTVVVLHWDWHAVSGMNQSRGVIHLYITKLHKNTKRDQNITKNNLTLVTCLVVLSNYNNSRKGVMGQHHAR